MSTFGESAEFLVKVKAHFGISAEEGYTDGWGINGEVLFFMPLGDPADYVFMLSTPLDECVLPQDRATRLTRAAALQRDTLLKCNASIAIDEGDQFGVLQQVIYPNTAEEACEAIEKFLALSKQLSNIIASLDNAEAGEEK